MKTIILGGPFSGKSTLALSMMQDEVPVYCTDSTEHAREVHNGVTYLPDGLEWSESSQWVADNWLTMKGPWIIEGVAVVRALRKSDVRPDRIIVFHRTYPGVVINSRQAGMFKGVMKVWKEIEHMYDPTTVEYR